MAQEMHPRDAIMQMIDLLEAASQDAAKVASARRKIFLAYVEEGFTEGQALELIKPTPGSLF